MKLEVLKMEIKIWQDNLNTGIPLIDIQHKSLFDLISYFISMNDEELTLDKISFIMTSLENYIQYHFTTEERFFSKCNYTNRDSHLEKHQVLLDMLDELKKMSDESKHVLIKGILLTLNRWFYNHMAYDDFDYVEQLKSYLKNGEIIKNK